MSPLVLEEEDSEKILWENPKPDSPRFCKVLEFFFKKETKEYINERIHFYEYKIAQLPPLEYENILITFDFDKTMVDGKVQNAMTDSSSRSCSICDAKYSELLDVHNMHYFGDKLKYGIPYLHMLI